MAILKILHYPDTRLRKIAKPVLTISNNTKKIIDNMFETMYVHKGIGLAATQVNINQQIIVMDICQQNIKSLVFINPVITQKSGIINDYTEGCLSIPAVYAAVPRAAKITVQSLNEYGKKIKIEAQDLLSVCIQHEIDHLIGKLFIDYLTPAKIKTINQPKILK